MDAFGELYEASSVFARRNRTKKTNFKIKGFKTVPRSCIMHSSLVNLSRGTKKRLEIALHIERVCVAVTLWYKHVFFLDFLTGVFYKMPKARGLESASKIKTCTAGKKNRLSKYGHDCMLLIMTHRSIAAEQDDDVPYALLKYVKL